MARSSQRVSTKDKILNAARDLFLEQGFAATSVDQICGKAKVTKGGFFHYFKSKDELGREVLSRFCTSAQKVMKDAGCCEKRPDPLDRVFANLDCVIKYSQSQGDYKGCLVASFTQEMAGTNAEIQAMCSENLRGWAKVIKEDLTLAKTKYAPKSSINVGSLAEYCVAVVEGAQVMAKATRNVSMVEKTIGHLKDYLSILFHKPSTQKRERS